MGGRVQVVPGKGRAAGFWQVGPGMANDPALCTALRVRNCDPKMPPSAGFTTFLDHIADGTTQVSGGRLFLEYQKEKKNC